MSLTIYHAHRRNFTIKEQLPNLVFFIQAITITAKHLTGSQRSLAMVSGVTMVKATFVIESEPSLIRM